MTEEVKKETTPEEKVETQVEKKEPSRLEQEALSMGWKPLEEFDGEEDDFIDAKEFVRRKPLFDRLEQQGKQLKNLTKTLEQFKGHYSKMKEVEFQRALEQLKEARKQAITDGDGDRYEAIDDRMKEVEKEAQRVLNEFKETEVDAPDPKEFQTWTGKNTWYQKDEAMTVYADSIGRKFAEQVQTGQLTPLQVLHKVEQAVRAEFPHKFKNPNKDNAPHVGEGKQPGKSSSKEVDLTEQERKIMDNLVRSKVMTKEEYLSDLRKAKGL